MSGGIPGRKSNKGAPGANYGWPCFEGSTPQPSYQPTFPVDCQAVPASAVTMPIYTYDHSLGSAAAIGGTFFTGTQYPAPYVGNFFFADYPQGWMKRIVFDGSGTVQSVLDFASNILDVNATGGPVAIELGPDGLLYYIVFTTGEIARIRNTSGTGSNFPPLAKAAATPSSGYSALNVSFSSAGSFDPEGGGLTYLWDFGDGATSTLPNPFHTYSATGVTLFTVHLTVTDTLGKQSTDALTITVGSMPPVATIDLPAIGAHSRWDRRPPTKGRPPIPIRDRCRGRRYTGPSCCTTTPTFTRLLTPPAPEAVSPSITTIHPPEPHGPLNSSSRRPIARD